jgi:hypothetical protein
VVDFCQTTSGRRNGGLIVNNRERNNVKADAVADQVKACIRDGVDIPKRLDITAAAVRIPSGDFSKRLSKKTKGAIRGLQELWSNELDVDTVK